MFTSDKQAENQSVKSTAKRRPLFWEGDHQPFFQAKQRVNQPGDEQEADRVADQVMRMKEGDAP